MNKREIPPPSLPGFENIRRYWDQENDIVVASLLLGDCYVTCENEMITTLLGSCLSACIRDAETGVGGMNHFMLPRTESTKLQRQTDLVISQALRYGNYAMEYLINTILSYGGKRKNLEVKLFGGGKIIASLGDIGEKNIQFMLDYINTEALHLIAQDLGDIYPRKVNYYPLTGRARVKKIKNLQEAQIMAEETQYQKRINHEPVEGDIEFF